MRIFTSLAVLLLCAFAISVGWEIVRFVEVRAEVFLQPRRVEMLRPWIGTPDLANLALGASLKASKKARSLAEAKKRAEDLVELLSERPLSARDWLKLAGLRLVTGKPFKRILAALRMSWIAGPNEGPTMMERGLFGLLEWQALPPDAQGRTVQDLAGGMEGGTTSPRQIALAKILLAAKPRRLRLQIAEELRTAGLSPAALSRLGL